MKKEQIQLFEALQIKIKNKIRISKNEAMLMYQKLELFQIGLLAHEVRKLKHPEKKVTYIIDRNINYTNICTASCQFCGFYRRLNHEEAYVITEEALKKKLEETLQLNGTGILIQGGLHPKLKLDYYQNLLITIKKFAPSIHIHGFSPPELIHLQKIEKKSLEYILLKLKEAGLDSIPGGGAEILVDSLRKNISKGKCDSQEWLSVMKAAHQLNISSTATMMFGHVESLEDKLEHLSKIRNLQDETHGFTAFIPWTYQKSEKTPLESKNIVSYEYLKTLALSRIFLDNIENVQGSWLTQGEAIAQMTLFFGANDLGSIMIEENVLNSVGVHIKMNESKIKKIILDAGYQAIQRRTLYEKIYN